MNISGLGLAPTDPCYDSAHPWYMPSFLNTHAECACMAANPETYPIGQQCATVAGTTQVALSPFATAANVIGYALGQGIAGAANAATHDLDFSGLLLIGAVGFGAYFLLQRR